MNSIELKVTKTTMSVSNIYTLNQGEYNVDKCVFNFTDDYNNLIKKAVFIYGDEDPIEMVILNNECNIPYEILQTANEFILKVYAYEVQNEELVQRYSPTPLKLFLIDGSYQGSNEVITPSQFEQYEAKLDEGLDDVADALGEVNTALQTMATATEETNRLNIDVSDKVDKDVTITLTKKDNTTKSVVISDGDDFQYNWDGTRLGVKTDKEESYSYVDLQGQQGPMGPQGEAFQIKKTYTTTQEMIADYDNMEVNDYVMISGSVEQQDNATLWVKTETEDPTYKWVYLADFSGASGIQGPTGATPNIQIGNVTQGDTPNVTRRGTDENPILDFTLVKGDKGNTGATGPTGNGISSVEKISTSGLVDTYRQTFTNGEHFDYDVTNGADGNVTDVQIDGTSIVDNGVANIEGYNELLSENSYLQTITQGLYNALPKATTTGESGTLNNTCENAPLKIGLGSNTEQDTTTGKNILNFKDYLTTNGATFTENADGSLTVTTTQALYDNPYSFSETDINVSLSGIITEGTATSVRINLLNSSDTSQGAIYNGANTLANKNASKVRLNWSSGGTVTIKNLMLENGASVTDYEPYTNGASPNPSYPQRVKVVSGDNEVVVFGKNLINSVEYNKGVSSSGAFSSGTDYLGINDFVACKPNTTYTITFEHNNPAGNLYVGYKDANGDFISRESYQLVRTFTTPSNAYSMFLYLNKSGVTFPTIGGYVQLEESSTATTYEPYNGDTYEVNLPVENLFNINGTHSTTACTVAINDGVLKQTNTGAYSRTVWELTNLVIGQSYTFSCDYKNDSGASLLISIRDSANSGLIVDSGAITTTSGKIKLSFVATETSVNIRIYSNSLNSSSSAVVEFSNIQFESGSNANTYNAYGNSAIEYCKIGNYKDEFVKGTGKNILPINLIETQTINGLTITNLGDGTIKVNGTSNATTRLDVSYSYTLKANKTYTFTNYNTRGTGANVNVQDSGGNVIGNIILNSTTGTITPTSDTTIALMRFYIDSGQSFSNYILRVQLEEGTGTYYEPYNSKDKWLLKKWFLKHIIDNTDVALISNYWYDTYAVYGAGVYKTHLNIPTTSTDRESLCNVSTKISGQTKEENTYAFNNNANYVFFFSSAFDTTEHANDKLVGQVLYYNLDTPYCINIPTSLQNQLNEIEKAVSKDGQTNVSQINNDIPFILDLETITKVSQGGTL